MLDVIVSYLIQDASEICWDDFKNMKTIAITAGASAPEILVEEIINSFSTRFEIEVETTSKLPMSLFHSNYHESFVTVGMD